MLTAQYVDPLNLQKDHIESDVSHRKWEGTEQEIKTCVTKTGSQKTKTNMPNVIKDQKPLKATDQIHIVPN